MKRASETGSFPPEALLRSMASSLQFPCRIFDERGLRTTAAELHRSFCWAPDFRQDFPVKTEPAVLPLLRSESMGALCTDKQDLLLAVQAGFDGSNIVFAPAVPTPEAMALAAELGCEQVMDDPSQILMAEMYGRLPARITLCCNPGGRLTTERHTLSRIEDSRFGMPRQQLLRAASILKSKGIRRLGLRLHLAERQSDPQFLPASASLLFSMAAELQAECGIRVDHCTVSGDIGYSHNELEPVPDLMRISEEIRRCYDSILVPAGMAQVALRTELGSFLTGNHGVLAAKVCMVKESYHCFLGVDASTAMLPPDYLAMARYPVELIQRENRVGRRFYHVVGNLPQQNDQLVLHRFLKEAEVGDVLVIRNVGHAGAVSCPAYLYTAAGALRRIGL